MSAIDELRRLLDERGVAHSDHYLSTTWRDRHGILHLAGEPMADGSLVVDMLTPEQAIAATLGRPKAKAHPYGYEPDTGAFDCTRCECGCINDISAKYCNDCGGEIEVDMDAEKEIYRTPRNSVFAEKHDDGTLEFGGKRYVAATLGSENCARCAEDMGRYADSLCDPLKERIAELLRCLENDWHISASWDGLRKFWCVELTEELGGGTCEIECFDDGVDEALDGEWISYAPPTWYLSCGHSAQGTEKPNFCPECGKAVKQ